MASLPITFRKSPEAIVSYDFFDMLSMIGYKTFYPLRNNEGDMLMPEAVDSNDQSTGVGEDFSSTITINFDTETIKKPVTLKGNAYLGFLLSAIDSGDGTSATIYIKAKFYHVSAAAVATAISSQITSDTLSTGTTNTWVYSRKAMTVALTETNFAIGEKIRLEIIITADTTGSGSRDAYLFHDPVMNDSGASGKDTRFKVLIPFKVDI